MQESCAVQLVITMVSGDDGLATQTSRLHVYFVGFALPILQPHFRKVFTTLGVMARVMGIRKKMRDLCTP